MKVCPRVTAGGLAVRHHLGLFSQALADGLWSLALRYVDGSVAGPYVNLVPVISLGLALAIGETLPPSSSSEERPSLSACGSTTTPTPVRGRAEARTPAVAGFVVVNSDECKRQPLTPPGSGQKAARRRPLSVS